jgi:hypothetical protein
MAAGLLLLSLGTTLHAQGLITTQKLSAALANELVGESVADCAKKGYKVVAVVVDLDGVRQAMLRGDGAPIHSVDNAYYKAYTIASLGLSRKEETTKQIQIAWRRRRPRPYRRRNCRTSPTRRARSPSWPAATPSAARRERRPGRAPR